jgi:hypothetical protein
MNFSAAPGLTIIRAEYIQGTQPGSPNSSLSPVTTVINPIYLRNFNGLYFYFVQNILQTKSQLVFKYDWYDPNIDLNGDQIGLAGSGTSEADIRFDTYGFGYIYRATNNVRFMAFYDIVKNERTQLAGTNSTDDYRKDIADNVLTLRMQYRF